MIIKSTRIKTASGYKGVHNHVLRTDENEKVEVLKGGEFNLIDAVDLAKRFNRKNAIRHFTISPSETITDDQRMDVLKAIKHEFGADLSNAMLIKHTKERADNTASNEHYHLLLPEVDTNGNVLDNKHSYLRQEKLCRELEYRFNHKMIPGRHNKAVVAALEKEGKHDVIARLKANAATIKQRPSASYTDAEHQTLKRKGISLPQQKQIIKDAYNNASHVSELRATLAEYGLQIKKGEKRDNTYIVMHGDTFIGALHRLTKQKKNDVKQFIERNNHNANDRQEKRQPESVPSRINQEGHNRNIGDTELRKGRGRGRSIDDDNTHNHRNPDRANETKRSPQRAKEYAKQQATKTTIKTLYKDNPNKYKNKRYELINEYNNERKRKQNTIKQQTKQSNDLPRHNGIFGFSTTPQLSVNLNELEGILRQRYSNKNVTITRKERSIEVRGDGWIMRDAGSHCYCHGDTQKAIEALCDKAINDWDGRMQIHGSEDFLNAAWLRCQQLGIEVSVRDDPSWQPSEDTQRAWKAEVAASYQEPADDSTRATEDDYKPSSDQYQYDDEYDEINPTEDPPRLGM